jgi:hypothetical protein
MLLERPAIVQHESVTRHRNPDPKGA